MGLKSLFGGKAKAPTYTASMRSYMDDYDGKPVYAMVDMGLADIAPVPEYSCYIAVILPVKVNPASGDGPRVPDEEVRVLHKIENRCIREAKGAGFLYAGHAIVTAAEHMYVALYCRETNMDTTIDILRKICRDSGREPTRVLCKTDRDWGYYLDRLYPDIYQMQPMNHQEILDDLKKHGDSGIKPRAVTFWLYFLTKNEAERCQKDAEAAGYSPDNLNDMREDKSFTGSKPFALTLKKELPMNMETLNAEAWKLIDLAKKFNGDYDGIETDVVKGG